MRTNADLYDQDFFQWTQTTAALISAGKWQDLDLERVAEELESLGKRDWRELESRLEVLIRHLLKWRYQPERRARSRSWPSTIQEQRRRLARLLAQSPSLRPALMAALPEEYRHARQRASYETRFPEDTFPPVCPWTADELLDPEFWPEG
jgi:hypothetical protein